MDFLRSTSAANQSLHSGSTGRPNRSASLDRMNAGFPEHSTVRFESVSHGAVVDANSAETPITCFTVRRLPGAATVPRKTRGDSPNRTRSGGKSGPDA